VPLASLDGTGIKTKELTRLSIAAAASSASSNSTKAKPRCFSAQYTHSHTQYYINFWVAQLIIIYEVLYNIAFTRSFNANA